MKWYNPWTWFPFTHEGRQTLIYLVFAGAGPVLTLAGLEIMRRTEQREQWDIFGQQAWVFGMSLLIVVLALGGFVSIRAFKLGKDGLEFTSRGPDPVPKLAEEIQDKAEEIKQVAEGSGNGNAASE